MTRIYYFEMLDVLIRVKILMSIREKFRLYLLFRLVS